MPNALIYTNCFDRLMRNITTKNENIDLDFSLKFWWTWRVIGYQACIFVGFLTVLKCEPEMLL